MRALSVPRPTNSGNKASRALSSQYRGFTVCTTMAGGAKLRRELSGSRAMSMVVGKLRSAVLLLCASALVVSIDARETNRDALRQIVQEECVVHWLRESRPTPCESVSLADSQHEDEGYAVLADIKGGAHFL